LSADQATAPWWTAASPAGIRYGTTRLDLLNPNATLAVARNESGSGIQDNSAVGASIGLNAASTGSEDSNTTIDNPVESASPRQVPRVTIIGVRVREASRDTTEPLQDSEFDTNEPPALTLPPPPPPAWLEPCLG
jgi:hypothetical protein